MQQNVDGFGYELQFLGDDERKRSEREPTNQWSKLKDFFDLINEEESFTSVRKKCREDYEVLGNAAIEVVRNIAGHIQMLYYLPFEHVRITSTPEKPVAVPYKIRRDGREIKVNVRKRFRKFVEISQRTGRKARWFKPLGDPRVMDALSGEYKNSKRECKMVASEVLSIPRPFGGFAYGMPRWIGAVMDVLGRTKASFVNYDLFDSQGIPPLAVLVSGGMLTDDSIDELKTLLRSARGAEKWNRILLLEAASQSMGLEDEKQGAKIDIKNLSEYRKEDLMFQQYLKRAKENVRHVYRIPPLYVGSSEAYTHATSKTSQAVAEEQIFIPEREGFDELINIQLVQREMGVNLWRYKSKGPQIVGAKEISEGLTAFSDAGAISVNTAIELANRAFRLELPRFSQEWADLPLKLVIKAMESGKMQGEELEPLKLLKWDKEAKVPVVKEGGKLSEAFSEEERKLYSALSFLRNTVENLTPNTPSTEDNHATGSSGSDET